jgi:hypothetical protein
MRAAHRHTEAPPHHYGQQRQPLPHCGSERAACSRPAVAAPWIAGAERCVRRVTPPQTGQLGSGAAAGCILSNIEWHSKHSKS